MLAIKIDGQWTLWTETRDFIKTVATRTETYLDGRVLEQQPCKPYPLMVTLSPNEVVETIWTDEERAEYGIVRVVEFVPPEGKRRTGAARLIEKKGVVSQEFDTENVPELVSEAEPEPLTSLEKLSAAGLTLDDLRTLIDEAGKR